MNHIDTVFVDKYIKSLNIVGIDNISRNYKNTDYSSKEYIIEINHKNNKYYINNKKVLHNFSLLYNTQKQNNKNNYFVTISDDYDEKMVEVIIEDIYEQ